MFPLHLHFSHLSMLSVPSSSKCITMNHYLSNLDVPRTSRIRPTASNRRLRQKLVVDNDEDDKEVVEEHPKAQEQTEVHKQVEEVCQRTSTGGQDRTGEIPGGPTSLSLLRSFRTHIATSIWQKQERPPLKCLSHAQKISV
ncbi:hypothetical protein CKAN_02759100 [Cinnamomum micranthum f. kanehirae]|uniref:Uncharacterized protein n=1 Tax=Cinnamomum micranthum f. kanehirae TaxID=337451 RepID=A0A443Q513_9MAGN|nr:hypothetical protein CKAN_02759100 [Cinnamomum micranthum f. kanehirae]